MEGQTMVPLMLAVPVALMPAILIWYLNIGILREVFGKRDWQELLRSRW